MPISEKPIGLDETSKTEYAAVEGDVRPASSYKPIVSHLGDDSFGNSGIGRRTFFDYRDLGILDATDGDFHFKVVKAKEGYTVSTGWHYHTCELQVIYCVKGWQDIQLEDGRLVRLVPGTCMNIPPGYGHIELEYSPDMEMLAFYKPALVGTTQIPAPDFGESTRA